MTNGAELWADGKALLLPYHGMASQLYVLDLPLENLEFVLNKLSDEISRPKVVLFGRENSAPLTSDLKKELRSCSEETGYHILSGDWAPGKELSVWLWINASRATFDAELVFWSDLLFPNPNNEAACIEAFGKIVGLAETLRGINPSCECVLSASETGDPRNERDEPWTLFF